MNIWIIMTNNVRVVRIILFFLLLDAGFLLLQILKHLSDKGVKEKVGKVNVQWPHSFGHEVSWCEDQGLVVGACCKWGDDGPNQSSVGGLWIRDGFCPHRLSLRWWSLEALVALQLVSVICWGGASSNMEILSSRVLFNWLWLLSSLIICMNWYIIFFARTTISLFTLTIWMPL